MVCSALSCNIPVKSQSQKPRDWFLTALQTSLLPKITIFQQQYWTNGCDLGHREWGTWMVDYVALCLQTNKYKNPTNNIVTKNHFKNTGYILCCKNLVAWRQPNYTYLHIFYTVDDDIKRWEIGKNIYDLQSVTSILVPFRYVHHYGIRYFSRSWVLYLARLQL